MGCKQSKSQQSKAHQTSVCLRWWNSTFSLSLHISLSVCCAATVRCVILYMYYICVFVTFSINAAIMCVISCLEYQATQKRSSSARYYLLCLVVLFLFLLFYLISMLCLLSHDGESLIFLLLMLSCCRA